MLVRDRFTALRAALLRARFEVVDRAVRDQSARPRAVAMPAWAWLLPLALLVLLYPVSTWRDAPLWSWPATGRAALSRRRSSVAYQAPSPRR